MHYPSTILENAVEEIAQLPGIGRRTALRLALHLLKRPAGQTDNLARAITRLVHEINHCKKCHMLCDTELCDICADNNRDHTVICVVEDIRDVMAIENTGQYRGVYHVLGGKISPMEGIGPEQLNIKSLIDKAETASEFIFALSSTVEGDTTIFYLYKILKGKNIKTSIISRGIGVGDELEYTDELTLGRSITHRIPYEETL